VKKNLVDVLRCTQCGSGLALREARSEGGEVLEGALGCDNGHTYDVVRGILRMVKSDAYVGSFSFEWQRHNKTQLDREENGKSAQVFYHKAGLTPGFLKGKRVLDVGVGAGRFADVCQRAGADVVGIDLSYAVESAMQNVGHRQGANIVQADLFDLPFRDESFDLIYSIGVLHHTPDCKRAFQGLIRFLRPGGTIVIWVYNAHVWSPGSVLERVNSLWRSVTTRLPPRLLYLLCLGEVPLYYLRRIPGADQIMHLLLPGILYHAIPKTNDHPRLSEHVLDTFDWYSPTYQSKHTYPEVYGWFEQAGLKNIRVLPHPVGMSGEKRIAGHS